MPNKETFTTTRQWIKDELVRCVDFWMPNGPDTVNGGMYTCLDRQGLVYSTDKSVWMQGRTAYIFSRLCRQYGVKDEWLKVADSCLQFMEDHCLNRDLGGRMYFQVTADGQPLRQRRYNFSEGFYAMANAEYYALTGKVECLDRARWAYDLIWQLNHGQINDPVGQGAKTNKDVRPGRGLADPMIYLNLTSVMRDVDKDPHWQATYDERAKICLHDIFTYHRKKDMNITLEFVGPEGEFYADVTQGRVVNPGHVIECSWFVMQEALRLGDKELYGEALSMFDDAINAGWDKEYDGLLYFVDCLGRPPEAYEHDMKLWWPHNEILIASLMAYRDTGDKRYWDWFEKTLNYCKKVFSDPENGEWYGYLRRDGKPTEPAAKGSTFKGPFHLPRALMMVDQMLGELISKAE